MSDRECSRANFLFSNVEAWQLFSPQRKDSKSAKVVWLVWTWIWAVILFIFLGISTSQREWNPEGINTHLWFVYLTNWVNLIYVISMVIRTAVVTYCLYHPVDEVRWYLKLHWIFYNMAAAPSIVVATFFWAFVYNPDENKNKLTVSGTVAHAVLAAHAVLDITFISGMRLRVLHIYIPMVFGLVYGIFSSIYDLSGGMSPHGDTYIYKVLDWSESLGSATVYFVMAIALVGISHCLLFGLSKLRVYVYSRLGVAPSKLKSKDGGDVEKSDPPISHHVE